MAAKVDGQNAGDPLYEPMSGHETTSLAYQAAQALVFEGIAQPNGYMLIAHGRRQATDVSPFLSASYSVGPSMISWIIRCDAESASHL